MRITPFPNAYAKAYTNQIGAPNPMEQNNPSTVKPVAAFGEELKTQIREVDDMQHDVDKTLNQGAVQGAQNIHESMIQLEKADMSFRLLVKTRNKAIEAYQEVMRMQF